ETATLIRAREQSETTPIIFITAHARAEVRPDLYSGGAVDVIFAPVRPEELRAKVSVFASLFNRADELAVRAREVQSTADQLRLLTDAAPVGIFQTDCRNRYVYTNPRWSEITGISAAAALGERWDTIIGSDERAVLVAESPDGNVDRADISHRFETAVAGAASRIVHVTSRSIPDSDGGIAGWVGTLSDVTAEAGAEAAMAEARDKANEASQLKSDFLANMSHEIRTPMNGVIGMTDLLLETELDARQRDYAQTVRNSGEALLTVINDILDFSKVEAGKLDMEEVEFELRPVVDGVVDLLATSAQAKGLELVAVVDDAVPGVISGDPGRIRQVLINLIGNAIKFTAAGEVVVRVSREQPVGADAVIRFEICDTGAGIPAEKLALIFEPFVQVDTSTSRRYGGTGLGLSISGQLVALMGGDCGVTSTLGSGSAFWFTIGVHADAGEPHRELLSPDDGLAGIRGLIVDDNATQRAVLAGYLTGWGMTVVAVESGAAALDELRAAAAAGQPYADAVLDRSMPEMDGLALKNAIVNDPALDVRLVLMTDVGHERDHGDSAESGIGATLSKPIRRESLRACLRVALSLEPAEVARTDASARPVTTYEGPVLGRLLLAEDNLINQKVAVAMLASAGYCVDTVLDGAAAVKAVAAHAYDAVLMDVQMAELDGYEATAAIRSREGNGRRTTIIAMTAEARSEDRERCLAGGMDGYLSKPVSKDALLALVAQTIKSRSS
ncbi:MAG: response regulator, partial [Gaiellaceae bacterium]